MASQFGFRRTLLRTWGSFTDLFSRRDRRARLSRRTNERRRIALDPLEDRRMLSTFYVDDTLFIETDNGAPGLDNGDIVTFAQGEANETTGLIFGSEAFSTIQAGINAAAPTGDTVLVAPGTYNENLLVNKQLTLDGAGSGSNPASNTVLDGSVGGIPSSAITITASGTSAVDRVVVKDLYIQGIQTNAIDIGTAVQYVTVQNVAGFGNEGSMAPAYRRGVWLHGTGQIQDLVLDGMNLSGYYNGGVYVDTPTPVNGFTLTNSTLANNRIGLHTYADPGSTTNENNFTNVTITDNYIFNNAWKGLYFEKLNNAVISGNTFEDTGLGGPAPAVGNSNGNGNSAVELNLKYGNFSNIQILNNIFDNSGVRTGVGPNDVSGALAIKPRNDAPSYSGNPAALDNVIVSGNVFQNIPAPGRSILIGETGKNTITPTNLVITGNTLSDGVFPGVVNTTAGTVNAENNYWGTTNGALIATLASGPVDFTPFLDSPITVVTGTPGADDFTLVANGAYVDLYNGMTLVFHKLASTLTAGLVINGSDGADTFTIDYTNGNPIAGPITFNGGDPTTAPGDALIVLGGTHGTINVTYTNATDGTVDLDGAIVNYTGLEPVLLNVGTVADIVFNLPIAAANQARLEDDGNLANGVSQLFPVNGTFETTTFANPTNSLTINAGPLGDYLTVVQTDDTYTAATTFVAAAGADRLYVDFGSGVNVIPTGGLTFTGSGNNDGFALFPGYAATAVTHNHSAIQGNGNVNVDGRLITYTGIANGVGIFDQLSAVTRTFTFSSATDDDVTFADDGTAGDGVLRLTGNFTVITDFESPTGKLVIATGGGNDTVTINSLDSSYSAGLDIFGDADTDVVNLNADLAVGSAILPGEVVVTAETISIASTSIATNLGPDAGPIIFTGNVNLLAHTLWNTDSLAGVDGNINLLGAVNGAFDLTLIAGSGHVSLGPVGGSTPLANLSIDSATNVSFITVGDQLSITNNLSINNAGNTSFNIDSSSIGGALTINSGGNVSIAGTGPLAVTGIATITAGGSVSSTNGVALDLTASDLIAHTGTGIVLDTTVDSITAINSLSGVISIGNSTGTTLLVVNNLAGDTMISTDGNMFVDSAAATTVLTLLAFNGAIIDINSTLTNAFAPSMGLVSASGIDLDIRADVITAFATNGTINLSEFDSVTIASAFGITTGLGDVTLSGGMFLLDGVVGGNISASNTYVLAGATLAGAGSVIGTLSDIFGGNISPGSSPAIINTGNLLIDSNSIYTVEINGLVPGSDHDQLNVTGTVTIIAAALVGTVGYVPTPDDQIVIINNDGVDPVVGNFIGTSEGSTVPGFPGWYISYVGGTDANDVVLTFNSAPTTSGIGNVVVNEDAPNTVIDLFPAFADVNTPDNQLVYTITGNTNPALFTSTVIQVNPLTGTLTLDYAADAFGAADITVRATDPSGAFVETTFSVTVNSVNDAPSYVIGPNQVVDEDALPQVVNPWATSISAGPANEAGQVLTFLVTGNSNPALFAAGPSISPTGVLSYTLNPNANGVATITIVLMDNGGTLNGGIDSSIAQSFTITVNAINDAPVNTVPAEITTPKNTPVVFSNVSGLPVTVDDVDAQAGLEAVLLSVSGGTLTLGSTLGLFSVVGNGTATVAIVGNLSSLKNAMNGLTFTPTLNFTGHVVFTIGSNDLGNTGAGGPLTDVDQFEIHIPGNPGDVSFTTATDFLGPSDDRAYGVATQADGKAVVVGATLNSIFGRYEFAVARYNEDGSLDTSFGGTGKVNTPFGAGQATARDVAIQPDGKIVVVGNAVGTTNQDFAVARYNANGTLDGTFGNGGTVTIPVGTFDDYAYGVVLQPDGKIVLTGSASNGVFDDVALVRLNPNGSLDGTFGTGGKVVNAFSATKDLAYDIVRQVDGKLVIVGTTQGAGINEDLLVARFNLDGTIDGTFGTAGSTQISLGSVDVLRAAAIQADGKILAVGETSSAALSDIVVLRLNTNGSPDASFDGDGIASPSFNQYDYGTGIAVTGDRIVVGGYTFTGGTNADFALAQLLLNGSLDTGFSGDGLLTLPILAGQDQANALALGDCVVYLAGAAQVGGTQFDFGVASIYAGNTPPVVVGPIAPVVVNEDAPNTVIDLSTVFFDANGPSFTYTIVANSNPGLFATNIGDGPGQTLTLDYLADAFGSATITVRATDHCGEFVDATFSVTINAVNDAPSFNIPTDEIFVDDTAGLQTIPGFATNILPGPANEAGQVLTFTVVATNPALFLVQPAIDAAGTLTYTPAPGAVGTSLITVTLMDNGGVLNGGVDTSAPQFFNISVDVFNDPPVNTVPGVQTVNQGFPLVFSTARGNPISIADPDAGNAVVQVTLSSSNGTLSLGSTVGLTSLSGNGSNLIILTGSISVINQALNGLTFNPTPGYSGPASMQIETNDLNNTGLGGPQTDIDPIGINVVSVFLVSGTTLNVNGTVNDDLLQIVFHTATSYTVTLNGFSQSFDTSTLSNIVFQGNGGNDVSVFIGSAGVDLATLSSNAVGISGVGYTVQINNTDTNYLFGGANDKATFFGTAGNDVYYGLPQYTLMYGAGYYNQVTGYGQAAVNGNGGSDVAVLFDSAGDDTFVTGPTGTILTGAGYANIVVNIGSIYALGSTGNDAATFFDTAIDDVFYGMTAVSVMVGSGYFTETVSFDTVLVIGSTGADVAVLYDSVSNDTFNASPTSSILFGTGFSYQVNGFDTVVGIASVGLDTANFADSAGNDAFYGYFGNSSMISGGLVQQALYFDNVNVNANAGGSDTGFLFDSVGNDLLNLSGANADIIFGIGGFINTVGLEGVFANSSLGGVDDETQTLPLAFALTLTGAWV